MMQARHLNKGYRRRTVLKDASLTVAPGQCVILTGDNGSGKTTLMHVLVGLRRPDAGEVVWKGRNLIGASGRTWREARAAWGFLPQKVTLPPGASVARILNFHARLRGTGRKPAYDWLERVGLSASRRQRVEELSGGMQQRLGIALTLFFQPEFIVMDEPGSSLDPGWRGSLAGWADEQAARGAAVLISSQLHESWGDNVIHRRCEAGRVVDPDAAEITTP